MRENLEYIKRTKFSEENKIDMILRTEKSYGKKTKPYATN